MQPTNPYGKWYHCLCCCLQPKIRQNTKENEELPQSNGGQWDKGAFHAGALPATEEFRREFEGK